jgi:hypothetical protein
MALSTSPMDRIWIDDISTPALAPPPPPPPRYPSTAASPPGTAYAACRSREDSNAACSRLRASE